MIKSTKSISMIEARKILSKIHTDKSKKVSTFIKKFTKLETSKAEKLLEELKNLGMLKLKEEHLVKIIDILPQDAEDLRKIFVDINLDQNEINQILEVVKKYM